MVTVFIPTYNSGAQIAETLNSVLEQSYDNIEIILIDDASTDNTVDILEKYKKRDSRINYFIKKHQGSVPYSWNFVFPHIHGEWTFYMSHDDLLSKDCLKLLVEHAESCHAEAAIPACVAFEKNNDIPEPKYMSFNKKNALEGRKKNISGRKAFSLLLNYDIPGFALWKTSLVKEIGMPLDAYNSDEGMQRIWALNCRKVVLCPKAKFFYRMIDGSITRGLKAYHYGSLMTQRRLLRAAWDNKIFNINVIRFLCLFFRSLRYLKKQYAIRYNEYSIQEQQFIKKTINSPVFIK